MGEWTTEQIRELLTEECGLTDRQVDGWLAAHDAEVAREAAEKAWDECVDAMDRYLDEQERSRIANWQQGGGWDVAKPVNPYRKPEPPAPFDLDAKLAEAGLPPFPTIRKEDSNG